MRIESCLAMKISELEMQSYYLINSTNCVDVPLILNTTEIKMDSMGRAMSGGAPIFTVPVCQAFVQEWG